MKKLFFALCLLAFAIVSVRPVVADTCHAIQVAEATPCVQSQVQPLRSSGIYNETKSATDNGDGTQTVTFTFTPKCYNNNPPCLLSTKIVTATVDCASGTATCP